MRDLLHSLRGFLGLVLVAALAGCAPDPLPGEVLSADLAQGSRAETDDATLDPWLVLLDGRPVTLSEVERRIASLSPFGQRFFQSPQTKLQYLEFLVWIDTIALDAVERGWTDGGPGSVLPLEALARLVLDDATSAQLNAAEVDEAALRERFDALFPQLVRPERRRVAVVVVPTREEAEEVVAEFEARVAEGLDEAGYIFRWLVRSRSTHPESRATNGELGWWVAAEHGGTTPPELEELIFSTPAGNIAGIVETERGFEVLYVNAVEAGHAPTFEGLRLYLAQRMALAERSASQRATLDAWREGASVDAEAVAELSSARAGGDEEHRPRRFSASGLASDADFLLGASYDPWREELDDAYRRNPRAALPLVIPELSEEGSGEPDAPTP